MGDLGESVDRFLEARVVAVHEQQHMPVRRLQFQQAAIEGGDRLFEIEPIGAHRDEVARWIAGRRRWPLDLADLAHGVGRYRNGDVGEGKSRGALAAEHDAGGI